MFFESLHRASSLILVAAAAVLSTGCPGTLENQDAFTSGATGTGGGSQGCTPESVPNDLIGTRCAKSNCHDAEAMAQNLDLTPDEGLEMRIVGVEATLCMGTQIVNPDAPEESTLYTKVLESNSCGSRMPLNDTKLTEEEEQCLLDWISSL